MPLEFLVFAVSADFFNSVSSIRVERELAQEQRRAGKEEQGVEQHQAGADRPVAP